MVQNKVVNLVHGEDLLVGKYKVVSALGCVGISKPGERC